LVTAAEGTVDTFDPQFNYSGRPAQYVLASTLSYVLQFGVKPITLRGGHRAQIVDVTRVVPDLAASWKAIGPKTVRMKMRPGLRWADGTPLDARAIVAGMKRTFGVKAAGAQVFPLTGLPDAEHVRLGPNNSVDFHLTAPVNDLFLGYSTIWNFSPIKASEVKAHATAKDPWATKWFQAHYPTANGPYTVASYTPGQEIVLNANPRYGGPNKPFFTNVRERFVPDGNQRVLLIERGDIDIAFDPPAEQLQGLASAKGVDLLSWPSADPVYLYLQESKPPFDNKLVRKAVAYAVPYNDIIKSVFHGYADPLKSLIPPNFPGSDSSAWTYNTDLKKAADLLKQAGFPNGSGLPSITLTTQLQDQTQRTALFIQQNLGKIGMKVELQSMPLASFLGQVYAKTLQFWIHDFQSFVWDAYYHANWIVHSNSVVNEENYKNAEVDKLLDQFYVQTRQKAARLAALKRIQSIVADELPVIPLYTPTFNLAVKKGIRGATYWNDSVTRYQYLSRSA
jgi:peptide/nickel transport system substrate-binding protein